MAPVLTQALLSTIQYIHSPGASIATKNWVGKYYWGAPPLPGGAFYSAKILVGDCPPCPPALTPLNSIL